MYDLVVIGAGPAGISASEYGAENGLKVALIDNEAIGGTCLNYGCIPAKTILNTVKILSQFKKSQKLAINAGVISVDPAQLNKRKQEIVERLKSGLLFLIKSKEIEYIGARAEVISANKVRAGDKVLETKYILLASGSKPQELPNIKFDYKKIISSKEALNIEPIPDKILIIGGGVIGCEFAQIFVSLGSKVTIAELTDSLLPGIDKEAAKKLQMVFKKKGADLLLNTDASSLDFNAYDKILLAVGRVPVCDCLGQAGVKLEKAKVLVNEYLQTNITNIYAAGDCIGGYFLAHTASYEGRLAVKNIINGNSRKADYKAVPSVVFTNPEIASVGLSEEKAGQIYGRNLNIKKLDFLSLGMSHVIDETDGFIKIICDKDDFILGTTIIGPRAAELIHVLTLAINCGIKSRRVRDTIFAHPTISEGITEALLRN